MQVSEEKSTRLSATVEQTTNIQQQITKRKKPHKYQGCFEPYFRDMDKVAGVDR